MAKAKVAFHIYDEKKAAVVLFEPGDTVPGHIADQVGEHCLDGKVARRTKKDETPDPSGATDGDESGQGAGDEGDESTGDEAPAAGGEG